jgi:hypothetical protein
MRSLVAAIILIASATAAEACVSESNGNPFGALAMALAPCPPGARTGPTQADQMQQLMWQRAMQPQPTYSEPIDTLTIYNTQNGRSVTCRDMGHVYSC